MSLFRSLLALSLSISASVSLANAEALSGSVLTLTCTNESGPNPAICSAYFLGFLSGMTMEMASRQSGRPICMPDGSDAEQLKEAFLKFSAAHREMMKKDADGLVGVAAALAFPCRKTK